MPWIERLARDKFYGILKEEQAGAQTRESGFRPDYVAALQVRARALLQLDRFQDTVAPADAGIQMAEEIKYLPMAWRIHAVKAQALEELGDAATAAREYEAAAAIVCKLADTIPDAELKQGYLSDPQVSSILAVLDDRR